jgi:hypothetical protein
MVLVKTAFPEASTTKLVAKKTVYAALKECNDKVDKAAHPTLAMHFSRLIKIKDDILTKLDYSPDLNSKQRYNSAVKRLERRLEHCAQEFLQGSVNTWAAFLEDPGAAADAAIEGVKSAMITSKPQATSTTPSTTPASAPPAHLTQSYPPPPQPAFTQAPRVATPSATVQANSTTSFATQFPSATNAFQDASTLKIPGISFKSSNTSTAFATNSPSATHAFQAADTSMEVDAASSTQLQLPTFNPSAMFGAGSGSNSINTESHDSPMGEAEPPAQPFMSFGTAPTAVQDTAMEDTSNVPSNKTPSVTVSLGMPVAFGASSAAPQASQQTTSGLGQFSGSNAEAASPSGSIDNSPSPAREQDGPRFEKDPTATKRRAPRPSASDEEAKFEARTAVAEDYKVVSDFTRWASEEDKAVEKIRLDAEARRQAARKVNDSKAVEIVVAGVKKKIVPLRANCFAPGHVPATMAPAIPPEPPAPQTTPSALDHLANAAAKASAAPPDDDKPTENVTSPPAPAPVSTSSPAARGPSKVDELVKSEEFTKARGPSNLPESTETTCTPPQAPQAQSQSENDTIAFLLSSISKMQTDFVGMQDTVRRLTSQSSALNTKMCSMETAHASKVKALETKVNGLEMQVEADSKSSAEAHGALMLRCDGLERQLQVSNEAAKKDREALVTTRLRCEQLEAAQDEIAKAPKEREDVVAARENAVTQLEERERTMAPPEEAPNKIETVLVHPKTKEPDTFKPADAPAASTLHTTQEPTQTPTSLPTTNDTSTSPPPYFPLLYFCRCAPASRTENSPSSTTHGTTPTGSIRTFSTRSLMRAKMRILVR